MTISFFFTLLSFLVMIVISVLTYRLHKKKTLITFDVQQGIKCYSCKQLHPMQMDIAYTRDKSRWCWLICELCLPHW